MVNGQLLYTVKVRAVAPATKVSATAKATFFMAARRVREEVWAERRGTGAHWGIPCSFCRLLYRKATPMVSLKGKLGIL